MSTTLSKIATYASTALDYATSFVVAHPKTTIVIGVVLFVVGHVL